MEHVRALAESEATLPPIIVHRPSLRIIDGMHRLRAAMVRGRDDIEVQFFDGDAKDSFVLAVEANIAHGLPLSLTDRKAAAARIINSHPKWSDRMITSTVGLAARTVSVIRRSCSTVQNSQSNTRIGGDGRVRPLDSTQGRKIARELMINKPDATLRQIASAAGISLGTAYNVRKRLRHGSENAPVAKKRDENQGKQQLDRPGLRSRRKEQIAKRLSIKNRASILNNLRKDPSLRFANTGRLLLRLLHLLALGAGEWERLIDNVPAHCKPVVANAARACAYAWLDFAERLDTRTPDNREDCRV
ncbi:MAG: ParB-like nuclease domain-containing protein [Pseudonocardiales bacterium]|nr:ParB-like nuclease domain-containing protein [Pseudonocardiales bacterium]